MFHVLPNDPYFKSLTPLQLSWITENILLDNKEQDAYIKGSRGVSTSTVATESSDFDQFVKSKRPARK